MNELVTITEFQKLRQKFHKETGMYAIKHKIEYTHWLEQELVNNINYTRCCESDSEQLLCKHCDNKKVLHSEATGLCPDRFKHFEAK